MSSDDHKRSGHAGTSRTKHDDSPGRKAAASPEADVPTGPDNVLRDGGGEPVVTGQNSSTSSANTRRALV